MSGAYNVGLRRICSINLFRSMVVRVQFVIEVRRVLNFRYKTNASHNVLRKTYFYFAFFTDRFFN
jgi:hypothetical protein